MKRLIGFETALRQRATARTRLKFADPVGDPQNNTSYDYSTCRRCGYHVHAPTCPIQRWTRLYMGQHIPEGARVISVTHDEVILEYTEPAALDFISVSFVVDDPPPCLY